MEQGRAAKFEEAMDQDGAISFIAKPIKQSLSF
jgi:hypothetical protein